MPGSHLLVGESGLATPEHLERLSRTGINAFLIGESLMRKPDVEAATRDILHRERASTVGA